MFNPRHFILLGTFVTFILLASMAASYCNDLFHPSNTAASSFTQHKFSDDDQTDVQITFYPPQINDLATIDFSFNAYLVLLHKTSENNFRLDSIYFDIFVPPQNAC
jgi:hypothetical protein